MNATIIPFPSPAMDEETARKELARIRQEIADLEKKKAEGVAKLAKIQKREGWTDSMVESFNLLEQEFRLATSKEELKKTISALVSQATAESPDLWPNFLKCLYGATQTHHSLDQYLDFCLTYQGAGWERITGSTTRDIETAKALIAKMFKVVSQLVQPLLPTIETARNLFSKDGNTRGADFKDVFRCFLYLSLRDAVGTTSE